MQALRKLRGHRDLFAHRRDSPRHEQRGLYTGPTALSVRQDAPGAPIRRGEGVIATMRAACAIVGWRANRWLRKKIGERASGTAEVSRQIGRMLHGWGGTALDPVPQRKVLAVDVFNELLRRQIPPEQSSGSQGLRRAATSNHWLASCGGAWANTAPLTG